MNSKVLKKHFDEKPSLPFGQAENNELAFDLGELLQLKGFTYFPNASPISKLDLFRNYEFKFPLMGNLGKLFPKENSPYCQYPIPQEVSIWFGKEAQFIRPESDPKLRMGNSATFRRTR